MLQLHIEAYDVSQLGQIHKDNNHKFATPNIYPTVSYMASKYF